MNSIISSRFKKIAAITFSLCALFLFKTHIVYASGLEDEVSEFDIQAQYEASGADRLIDDLPDYAAEELEKAGIDHSDISSFTDFEPIGVIHSAISVTQDEAKAPAAVLGSVIAVLLLASLMKNGRQLSDSSLSPAFGAVISLAVGIALVTPVASVIDSAGEAVESACRFNEAFGAVFVGILLANGQSVTAARYSSFLLGATEAASVCVNDTVMPMLRIFLALSCISALSEEVRIDAVIHFFEKYAKWLLSFMAVLITAVLGISGLLSASADSVSTRAAKFVISGSVPVVGGAMSDAYLSIRSGMTLLRNSVGAFGIIGVGYIFLPVIIRVILWSFVTNISEALCEAFQLDTTGKLLKSVSSMLSLTLGTLVFSLFLLTVSGIIVIMQHSA